jgi:hypothetical protein
VILRYPILPTTKWNTSIPTSTMIFVIDMGIMQLYPIHEFKKMDVNMLMVVLVI